MQRNQAQTTIHISILYSQFYTSLSFYCTDIIAIIPYISRTNHAKYT
nr:MAG TPA: hypothetical protein [Caudoviricetes sp.]